MKKEGSVVSPVSGVSASGGFENGSKIYLPSASIKIYFRQSKRELGISWFPFCRRFQRNQSKFPICVCTKKKTLLVFF
ncbi:hypothetical protein CH372_16035 [Leptospira meyeri]|nr:hypothetical protein CH372_16035 [Leptospira meyeri]